MTKLIDIEELSRKATQAALDVLDNELSNTSKQAAGPCGDDLAFMLDKIIREAIEKHMTSDLAPMF